MYNLGLYRLRLDSQKGHRLNICSVTKYKGIWFHRLPKGNREKNNLISFYSKLKLNNTNTRSITHGSTLLHAKIFTSSCQSKKKGAIQSIFHKAKSNFHMTVLCSEICSCLFFDYKDYPFFILIAFYFEIISDSQKSSKDGTESSCISITQFLLLLSPYSTWEHLSKKNLKDWHDMLRIMRFWTFIFH